jgi:hypothetical protein
MAVTIKAPLGAGIFILIIFEGTLFAVINQVQARHMFSEEQVMKAVPQCSHCNLTRGQIGFIMEVIRSRRSNNDRSTTE